MNRSIFLAAVLVASAAAAGSSLAQDAYPSRPVTTIVLFPPGGGTDTGAHWVAQELSKNWGQSVIDSEKAKYRKIITEKNISATE